MESRLGSCLFGPKQGNQVPTPPEVSKSRNSMLFANSTKSIPEPSFQAAQFVDFLFFGEWIEGFLVQVDEELSTVCVAHPYVEEQQIQVPTKKIADFRSKTNRSSLTSHLYACIWKYAHIDLSHELQSFLDTPNVSEERLIQVFGGVLPIGCAIWNSCLSPEDRDNEYLTLVCIALTNFLTRIVSSQVSITTLSRTWKSVSDAETIVFPFLKTLPEFQDLVKAHFQVIALEDRPSYVIDIFKDLMSYCCPPHLAWIMPDNTELPKIPLRKDILYIYGQAAIKYLEYCINHLDWFESFRVLLKILIANVQSVFPILNSEKLNSLLQDFASFKSHADYRARWNVALLLFSPPWKTDTLSNKNLVYWFSICSKACKNLLSTSPISTSFAFLQNCESSGSDSLLTRLVAEKLNSTFEQKITKASDDILVPLFRALKSVLKSRDNGYDQRDQVGSVKFYRIIKNTVLIEPWTSGDIHPAHKLQVLADFLCAELTLLFDHMKTGPEHNKDVGLIWPIAIEIESMLLKSIPDDSIAMRNLLLAHLEAISARISPVNFVMEFPSLQPHCQRFQQSLKYPKLNQAYLCANLAYCIRFNNWSGVVTVLRNVLGNNSIRHSKSMFDYMQLYLEQIASSFEGDSVQMKTEMCKLFFPLESSNAEQLQYERYSRSFEDFIVLTSFVSVSFLDSYGCTDDPDLFIRIGVELLDEDVKQVISRLPRHLVLFLWFTLRRHRTPYYSRKVEEFATEIKLPRLFSLWIYKKTMRFQGIPRTVMREVVFYI